MMRGGESVRLVIACVLVVAELGCARADESRSTEAAPPAGRDRAASQAAAGWWTDAAVIEAVGLDQEQLDAIDALYAEMRAGAAEARVAERMATTDLIRALRQAEVRPDVVEKHRERLAALVMANHERKVGRVIRLREILNHDQWMLMEQHAPHALSIGRFFPTASSGPVFISADPPDTAGE